MTLLEIFLAAAAVLSLLPATVLFLEVLPATIMRDSAEPDQGPRPALAIVMPAHNEASGIAATLRSLMPQLIHSDRMLVVADNCSDETAAIAAAEGAEVIERTDPTARGKGYALDFGVRHFEPRPPEIVIFVDADCQVAPGSIDRLARMCAQTGRPIQGLYLMRGGRHMDLRMRMAEFAWAVKNQARPMGLKRLGLPCQLMGTGMAFPWKGIKTAQLASGHIVEDLKLGIDLARGGTAPLFCPQALLTSDFPVSSAGIGAQRTRWEHGHIGSILSDAPRLLKDSLSPPNAGLLALALDLSVPPLALLTLVVTVVWLASALFFLLTTMSLPLDIATAAAALLGAAVLLSWARYGRRIISLGNLAFAPVYALRKIPLYGRFLVARQMEWVRSDRRGFRRHE